MPPHGPRSVPASRPASLFVRSARSPRLVLSFPRLFFRRFSCSRTQLPPSLFRRYSLSSPPPLRCANRSRTRASERAGRLQPRGERRERGGTIERGGERRRRKTISEYRIYMSERKRTAGEPVQEKRATGRTAGNQGGCTGEERWDTPQAERGRGRRETGRMLKRGRASGTP